jgi:hypothetical protein
MMICENCGYEVREGQKHQGDGDGSCMILTLEENKEPRVTGHARRKPPRDLYKKR